MRRALALAALLLALAAPAHAVSIDYAASDLGGNTLDFAVLEGGVLAIDPDFAVATPMRIVLVPEVGDPAPIVWNALVDNLTGELWGAFEVSAQAASVEIGGVRAIAGTVARIVSAPAHVRIELDPGEPVGLDLGAPFGLGIDWTLASLAGAPLAPVTLILTPIAVPEPVSIALVGVGLALLAARRRA